MDLFCLLQTGMGLVLLRYEMKHNSTFELIMLKFSLELLTQYLHTTICDVQKFLLALVFFYFSLFMQANRVRFEFQKGAADHTFMRMDGEPWKQPLPVDDDNVVVEISHLRQVSMLAIPGCRSRSIYDLPPASFPDAESNSVKEEYDEDWEERRKFGAADSFKFPDEIDIAHFS